MDEMAQAITIVGLAAVSAYLCVKGKDGFWWGFLAFCVLVFF